MSYALDRPFGTSRELIEYFLNDPCFRTSGKFNANFTGKGGVIFRGQSNSNWNLFPSAFREQAFDNFTPQPPPINFDRSDSHKSLAYHLNAEIKSIKLFLECADSLGIPTPIDYSTSIHGLEMLNALLRKDLKYDFGKPFPDSSFQRATALAQHHGVPTRFLDWSESPLVACFFAAYGASSFTNNIPLDAQEIAIYFLDSYPIQADESPIELIKAPRHENSHMKNQEGIFTSIKDANSFYLRNSRWPSFEEVSSNKCLICKVRLPAILADDLLRNLFDLNITRYSLMPTLDNASKSYSYVKTLFDGKQN